MRADPAISGLSCAEVFVPESYEFTVRGDILMDSSHLDTELNALT